MEPIQFWHVAEELLVWAGLVLGLATVVTFYSLRKLEG
jgi:hypothetical protein